MLVVTVVTVLETDLKNRLQQMSFLPLAHAEKIASPAEHEKCPTELQDRNVLSQVCQQVTAALISQDEVKPVGTIKLIS